MVASNGEGGGNYPPSRISTNVATTISATVALVWEHGNTKQWTISFAMRLFTTAYSGIVCSDVTYYVQGIVMKERGPIFFITFNPLFMIIMALLGSIILAEEITQERVIGAVIIVIGLHSLIWGKSNDHLDKEGVAELPMAAPNGICRGFTEDHTGIEIPLSRNLGI